MDQGKNKKSRGTNKYDARHIYFIPSSPIKNKMKDIGKEINLVELFPNEGEITQRYGRIGQGKTYGATVDVLDELKRGHIVYVNWHISFNGYDQRESILYVLGSLLFPWVNKFKKIPPENLRFINIDQNFINKFSKLTNCSVYLDEGHVVFDSYEMAKMSMEKRVAVLHTRHFDRSINIISQRPTAVHRMLRANVNRFYKYDKLIQVGRFILFRRTEYQDMVDENVDEESPVSVKLYIAKPSIFKKYNSKYLRGDIPIDVPSLKIYKVGYFRRIIRLMALLLGLSRRASARRVT